MEVVDLWRWWVREVLLYTVCGAAVGWGFTSRGKGVCGSRGVFTLPLSTRLELGQSQARVVLTPGGRPVGPGECLHTQLPPSPQVTHRQR